MPQWVFRLVASAALLVASARVAGAAVPAIAPGEVLTYNVSWTVIPAGEIKIFAENTLVNSAPGLRVITTTRTKGPASLLMSFDARGEALFELPSGRLMQTTDASKSDRKLTRSTVKFDYAKSEALYTDEVDARRSGIRPMPSGEPLDLIMSLIQTRSWDLKPGDTKDALVIFEGEFYELTLHALGYEDVRTSMGAFRTLVLEPRMDKSPPKGMFKRGSTVRVWISQDERRLPVKFRVDFKVGTGTATLVRHEKPVAKP